MTIQLTDILLAAILFFVFLMWLRGNPQAIGIKRAWRRLKNRIREYLKGNDD